MIIPIDVSEYHIIVGERASCDSCSLVLAIDEATERDGCEVHRFTVEMSVGDDGERVRVKLPVVARNFIEDFDAGRPVKPFSFSLEIPNELGLAVKQ